MEPLTRRALLAGGLGSMAWLMAGRSKAAPTLGGRSLIVLWLDGGPSQIETFDPKPGTKVGGPTQAIATAAKGVRIAEGLEQLAEQMADVSLVRSVVGQEGDHERATILFKTGRRPDVVMTHPSIGAVCAAELPEAGTEIPRYVSILGQPRAALGGYLGPRYDAFHIDDPARPVADVRAPVNEGRQSRRLAALRAMEKRFAESHPDIEARGSHLDRTERALRTMSSAQLAAFDVSSESRALRQAYGENPFGRGCLAARRLVEVGVRCVEVTLGGWDTHANNFNFTRDLKKQLDPGFATLIRDLRERQLLERCVVMCAGEFGRTPKINAAEGRDHWPNGFSIALAGGGLRGGQVVGETSPTANRKTPPKDAVAVKDVYATLLHAMGLDPETENITSIGRPMKLGEGKPLRQLLAKS